MAILKFYKVDSNVQLPKYQTEQSACFDLAYQPYGKKSVSGYNRVNAPVTRNIDSQTGRLVIPGGDRAMVPTGLILDIPEGYSVRVHPRSGLSFKQGIMLANCEGVIDSDYVEELYILVHNTSDVNFVVNVGDRIAQAELVQAIIPSIEETKERPTQKTSRNGGLGSTGISENTPKSRKEKLDKSVEV
jgi:dUTP pyrophosphatase